MGPVHCLPFSLHLAPTWSSQECQKSGQEEGALEVRAGPLSFEITCSDVCKFGLLELTGAFIGQEFPMGVRDYLIKDVEKFYLLLLPFNRLGDSGAKSEAKGGARQVPWLLCVKSTASTGIQSFPPLPANRSQGPPLVLGQSHQGRD